MATKLNCFTLGQKTTVGFLMPQWQLRPMTPKIPHALRCMHHASCLRASSKCVLIAASPKNRQQRQRVSLLHLPLMRTPSPTPTPSQIRFRFSVCLDFCFCIANYMQTSLISGQTDALPTTQQPQLLPFPYLSLELVPTSRGGNSGAAATCFCFSGNGFE